MLPKQELNIKGIKPITKLFILDPSNILLLLLPHPVKEQLLVANILRRRRGRDKKRRKSKGEKLQPLLVRMGESNLPLPIKLMIPILLKKLKRYDASLGSLERSIREPTILIYALAFQRCRECGPSFKDLVLMTYLCHLINLYYQLLGSHPNLLLKGIRL